MKKGMLSNKKRAIIATVVFSLMVGTLINAHSWYMLLMDGFSKESAYNNIQKNEMTYSDKNNVVDDVEKVVFDRELASVSTDNYIVYDEDYNVVQDGKSSIKNIATLGGLGLGADVKTMKCEETEEESEEDEIGLQQVENNKLKKAIKASGEELKLLACIINAEAKGEPYEGKLGVANVVLNRYRSKGFPNSIKKVIYQKSQFGPARNGALKRELNRYSKGVYKKNSAAKSSLKAAKEALNGRYTIGKYDFNKKLYFNGKRYSKPRKNNIIIKNHRFW